jgi:pimeloyl-ACP methyl ester carboxylesterase
MVVAVLVTASLFAQEPAARGSFADLPGVRLWFTDTGGSGQPIVLLHAATGTTESWAPQIEAFAKAGYRVVAFDPAAGAGPFRCQGPDRSRGRPRRISMRWCRT